MNKIALLAVAIIFGLTCAVQEAGAWCWIRDLGTTGDNCSGGTVQQDCCGGNLRVYPSGSMTYRISTSTSNDLYSDIRLGFATWNNVEMSTFSFQDGGMTSSYDAVLDGLNLINIDREFCTHQPSLCGQGILGVSGTWTSGSGTGYQAVESDILLNGEEYSWGDGSGGTIETVTVVAHEAGHNTGLSHAGATCRQAGSSGCGPEFEQATMYYAYDAGQPTNKESLELDEVAALVYGYPRSTLRVQVLDQAGSPVSGASVILIGSAAPVNGTGIATGGSVYGDVTNSSVLFGDKVSSGSYYDQTPFGATDSTGYTDYITPVHRSFQVRGESGGLSGTYNVALADGENSVTVILSSSGGGDGPVLSITSHTDNQYVTTSSITLAGTASDAGVGDDGVQQVTVNGERASNDTATGSGVANWSYSTTLSDGANTFAVIAYDNSDTHATTAATITIHYDVTPPSVTSVTPFINAVDVAINTSIIAQFSEDMDPATITTSSFTLDNGVTGTVSYADKAAYFNPSVDLSFGTLYTATILSTVTDLAGNAMAFPYSWTFTTQGASSATTVNRGGGAGCFLSTTK